MTRLPVLAALGLLAAMAAPASALNAVCTVQPTADGFAALRAGPSPSARLIARMKTGDNVHMHPRRQGELVRSGGWVQVTHWPDGQLYEPNERQFRTGRVGWVFQRLVGDCG